jgi:hypothetical protein
MPRARHRDRTDAPSGGEICACKERTRPIGAGGGEAGVRYNHCAMQKRAESRPIFWKFKLKRHYKPHLSVQVVGQMGTGTMTLCGTRIVGIHGSARTVLSLEGDECAKCAEKWAR